MIFFLFILSFYEISVVYGFVEITQIALVYRCHVFFLIEHDFFIVYFFIYIVKKHIITLYEVTKIKESTGNYCSPNTNCTMDYKRNPQCFASFFF
jgi:hypothetical protein